MNLSACAILAVLVLLCPFYSQTNALPANEPAINNNCKGERDPRCLKIVCAPDSLEVVKPQDNSKPFPDCCAGVSCMVREKEFSLDDYKVK